MFVRVLMFVRLRVLVFMRVLLMSLAAGRWMLVRVSANCRR